MVTETQTRTERKGPMTPKTQEVLDRLNDGIEKMVSSDDWKKGLKTLAQFRNYSWGNAILIATQKPNASLVAGFQQWRKKFRRHVKKGEKAIRIVAPSQYKKKEKDPVTGEERVVKSGLYFRIVCVFDVSQTDGEELVLPPRPERLGDEPADAADILAKLEAYAGTLGFRVDWISGAIDGADGLNGDCNYTLRRIRVRSDFSSAQRIKTLCHEIAHAILHEPAGVISNSTTAPSRNVMEVEAESTAYVVGTHLGLDTAAYTIPYVASWAKGQVDLVKKTGERIAKTARQMIDAIDGEEVTQ